MAKVTKKQALDAFGVILDFLSGTAAKAPAKGKGKAAAKPEPEELNLESLSLEGGGSEELSLEDGLGEGVGNTVGEVDPRYVELRKLMTTLAQAKGSKDLCYKILDLVECKDIDVVSLDDIDKVINLTKKEIAKAKK